MSVSSGAICRNGLDGCRWPSMNPRVLLCDFTNEQAFEWMREHGTSGDKRPPKHFLFSDSVSNKTKTSSQNGFADSRFIDKTTTNASGPLPARRTSESASAPEASALPDFAISEESSAVDKTPTAPPTSITDSESAIATLPETSIAPALITAANTTNTTYPAQVPAKQTSGSAGAPSSPAKLLDELFRKTTTLPSIFWLPVSEEEAVCLCIFRATLAKERLLVLPRKRTQTFDRQRSNRSPFTEHSSVPHGSAQTTHSASLCPTQLLAPVAIANVHRPSSIRTGDADKAVASSTDTLTTNTVSGRGDGIGSAPGRLPTSSRASDTVLTQTDVNKPPVAPDGQSKLVSAKQTTSLSIKGGSGRSDSLKLLSEKAKSNKRSSVEQTRPTDPTVAHSAKSYRVTPHNGESTSRNTSHREDRRTGSPASKRIRLGK
ncbi:unnamed protein product [Protopolystoma xenopodis]|uniref:Uncharacterized protein n=1 Tax=Protopolystoma xenopodis TaxID=117903 RepID=A0A3S5AWV8_9PLAT|nr:unnamed protein product [Protopolystoma xenopodis]